MRCWLEFGRFSFEPGVNTLAKRECLPCATGVAPLDGPRLQAIADELGADWKVVKSHHLEKLFRFKDFREALAFTNRVGELAEAQGHHPDIHLAWGKARLAIWTHKIERTDRERFYIRGQGG